MNLDSELFNTTDMMRVANFRMQADVDLQRRYAARETARRTISLQPPIGEQVYGLNVNQSCR